MGTLTQVKDRVYRINHPQTNAALTRMGGIPSPRLITRCMDAIGLTGIESVGYDIDFRRGNNTRQWYFQIEENNNVIR